MGRWRTFNSSLCFPATSWISFTYSPKPSVSRALVICSQAMVFLLSFSLISFASDEIRVINSTQHSISRSRASLPNARPEDGGRISVTIFWTVANRESANLLLKNIYQDTPSSARKSVRSVRVHPQLFGYSNPA